MTHAELSRRIEAREFPPLLFLYGEETYLLDRALRRLLDTAAPPESRDFNLTIFQGRATPVASIIDTALTLPVFASHRVVVVKDAHTLQAAELDSFLPYLKDPVPETLLVFTADKIDGRRKFFQEFKKHGALVEFKKLYDNQIPAFVREQTDEAGKALTEEGLALFCRRVGSNLQEVHGELVKLFTYLGERPLADVEDVAAIVSDSRVDSIFDLTNALGQRNVNEALRLLGRILEEGGAPLLVLAMITRHFRQLWQTQDLLAQDVSRQELARRVKVNPYFLDRLMAQARRFTSVQYRRIFELLLETDLALKSSGAHPTVLLEHLVLTIASAGSARP
ncbi:MAG TPA: DNA polymerase III subunit delta [Desulfuromonadales bacterium]|nr:DNA polymerase III subunit delta [Desulfuromonadales bacterium]